MKQRIRITLSGRNNQGSFRTVYVDDVELGFVVSNPNGLWAACDLNGNCHGDKWLTDWYAADALTRAPKVTK